MAKKVIKEPMSKISIRFYKDHKVRAVWDEENNHWWFSVLDIVGVINQQDDREKNRNYWKYLKAKLRKEKSEVVSDTTQLKLTGARKCLALLRHHKKDFKKMKMFQKVVIVILASFYLVLLNFTVTWMNWEDVESHLRT